MTEKLLSFLSIAGSDPTGGAGIQADIRVGTNLGLHVMTAITTVTVQNSHGLSAFQNISPSLLQRQLNAILQDVVPDAIKIGMVGSIDNIFTIVDFIDTLPQKVPVVVDPVMIASTGGSVFSNDGDKKGKLIEAYVDKLFPRATVITPNLKELEFFTGSRQIDESTLQKLNCRAAVIKGGHTESDVIQDILLTKNEKLGVKHERISCENLHGTGCVFSSLLAAYLAMGDSLKDAFVKTSRRIYIIISKSRQYMLGRSSYGPLNINENYYTI